MPVPSREGAARVKPHEDASPVDHAVQPAAADHRAAAAGPHHAGGLLPEVRLTVSERCRAAVVQVAF
jgi:hypothetical protein